MVLSLLVGIHEVASTSGCTIAIAAAKSLLLLLLLLLRAPDLLLAGLVRVYGLWERRGRGREGTTGVLLVLVVSVTATTAEAEIELQPVRRLLVVIVVVVVHDRRLVSARPVQSKQSAAGA